MSMGSEIQQLRIQNWLHGRELTITKLKIGKLTGMKIKNCSTRLFEFWVRIFNKLKIRWSLRFIRTYFIWKNVNVLERALLIVVRNVHFGIVKFWANTNSASHLFLGNTYYLTRSLGSRDTFFTSDRLQLSENWSSITSSRQTYKQNRTNQHTNSHNAWRRRETRGNNAFKTRNSMSCWSTIKLSEHHIQLIWNFRTRVAENIFRKIG